MFESLIGRLWRLLPASPLVVPPGGNARGDAIARMVVARHAEGSVRLGLGKYRTAAQIDASYESIKNVRL